MRWDRGWPARRGACSGAPCVWPPAPRSEASHIRAGAGPFLRGSARRICHWRACSSRPFPQSRAQPLPLDPWPDGPRARPSWRRARPDARPFWPRARPGSRRGAPRAHFDPRARARRLWRPCPFRRPPWARLRHRPSDCPCFSLPCRLPSCAPAALCRWTQPYPFAPQIEISDLRRRACQKRFFCPDRAHGYPSFRHHPRRDRPRHRRLLRRDSPP
ncbi:hypothetical protein JCM7686_2378 [Paracoccus aminophilus JCM 7686]|uniref:Uncharacterized protein n=1 Tax=Paracoccus aminophilus JCM 7686 TaxID=1367847 RepID=S5YDB8_PARAH|nr:hypothetical protein JCM7686_2378 [Paracoccus aminophilus JCM 7686]